MGVIITPCDSVVLGYRMIMQHLVEAACKHVKFYTKMQKQGPWF